MLKTKSEVHSSIQIFVVFAEKQFDAKIKVIKIDNGTEFFMNQFFNSKGILHQTTCTETPQQNGRVERKHQHLLNVARALLFQSKLPKIFWSYAVLHATYLINRIPTPLLNNQSPYEILFSTQPDFHDLKPFGCLCYASTLQSGRQKFDTRARKCIFLSFKPGIKGYVLLDMHSREVTISHNVVFFETHLPYVSHGYTFPDLHYTDCAHDTPKHCPFPLNLSMDDVPQPSLPTPPSPSPPAARVSERPKKVPSYLADYHCNQTGTPTSQSSSKVVYPLSDYISYSTLSATQQSFSLALSSESEPSNYNEAVQFACWRDAMKSEILALKANKTWIVVDLPVGVVPIVNKWVFKIKRKSDGSIERYKARLVAKGYNQIEGLDYFDTFSPVAKMTTIRLLLALAAVHNWHLHQLDVNNASVHGDLEEDVYMTLPLGFPSPGPNKVCKLTKSLYALKQASRKWFEKLSFVLVQCGYR